MRDSINFRAATDKLLVSWHTVNKPTETLEKWLNLHRKIKIHGKYDNKDYPDESVYIQNFIEAVNNSISMDSKRRVRNTAFSRQSSYTCGLFTAMHLFNHIRRLYQNEELKTNIDRIKFVREISSYMSPTKVKEEDLLEIGPHKDILKRLFDVEYLSRYEQICKTIEPVPTYYPVVDTSYGMAHILTACDLYQLPVYCTGIFSSHERKNPHVKHVHFSGKRNAPFKLDIFSVREVEKPEPTIAAPKGTNETVAKKLFFKGSERTPSPGRKVSSPPSMMTNLISLFDTQIQLFSTDKDLHSSQKETLRNLRTPELPLTMSPRRAGLFEDQMQFGLTTIQNIERHLKRRNHCGSMLFEFNNTELSESINFHFVMWYYLAESENEVKIIDAFQDPFTEKEFDRGVLPYDKFKETYGADAIVWSVSFFSPQ